MYPAREERDFCGSGDRAGVRLVESNRRLPAGRRRMDRKPQRGTLGEKTHATAKAT